MTSNGLLPEGLRDVLPPHAEAEALLLRQLLDTIAGHGYERVSPPLVEFEDSLSGRLGEARARGLFRFMDPLSQRTLALRDDMTTQVARIASHRLAHLQRPLRLSYGGPVLRVKGTQLRAERQHTQVGAELIGLDSPQAAAEVIGVAVEALLATGLDGVTLDLTMPDLVKELLAEHDLAGAQAETVAACLDAKDQGGLAAAGARWALPLVCAAGPLQSARKALAGAGVGQALAGHLDRVLAVADAVAAAFPAVQITLDPTEQHGFAFQSWFGVSLFARGVRGEIGRGGSYQVTGGGRSEAAVGVSLYLDGLVDAGRGVQARQRVLLLPGASAVEAVRLRAKGWATVALLESAGDVSTVARAQRCSHVLDGGTLRQLKD